MATKVIMPQLGESVVEGTVSIWLKTVGDSIDEYEALVEVSTDKVTTEIPAPASGTILEIYVEEGETVKAGTPLCLIGAAGEAPDDETSPVAEAQHASSGNGHVEKQAARPASITPRMSPVVARMVAEHDLDINQIPGTGREGRVTKKDVEAYLQREPSSQTVTATQEAPWEEPADGNLFRPTREIPIEAIPEGAPGELIRLNQMRSAIAEHMVRSKLQTAPHVTTVAEADMSRVLAHLDANKPTLAKQGVNLTLTAYFVQAMVAACQQYPILNCEWRAEGIYLHHAINVGVAVALDEGLIVPVIDHAEDLNLIGTARRVNDLATRARSKKLTPDEVRGGTISLSNHGVSGSLFATPIINQPQSAIMGVGIMEKRVKVIDDAIAIRPCCYIGLTFDHRVADGASADGWLMVVKKTLENWPAD
jgi:2-oxoglutarate dehydrogenase E2 component (dihydrolipoamide succinyltransferase)